MAKYNDSLALTSCRSSGDIFELLKVTNQIFTNELDYKIYKAAPATGIIYLINNFISGHVRMRGKDEGRYPFHYLEMLDNLFGADDNTIEVCSRSLSDLRYARVTVDIDPKYNPSFVTDGQTLAGIPNSFFNRWRCDPPYNEKTAREMYHCSLPNTAKLLQAGARVCKEGSLMFLLLGPQNYQPVPPGVTRIGLVFITIVPNSEMRALHIYLKEQDTPHDGAYQSQL